MHSTILLKSNDPQYLIWKISLKDFLVGCYIYIYFILF